MTIITTAERSSLFPLSQVLAGFPDGPGKAGRVRSLPSRRLKSRSTVKLSNPDPVKPLTDRSRMGEIYRLFHDCLVEEGELVPQRDGMLISHPELDSAAETTVLVSELGSDIIGTNTLTFDGPNGLNTDRYFKEETDRIRDRGVEGLCSSWRMAVSRDFRTSRIAVSLITETLIHAVGKGGSMCLFVFHVRRVPFYRKFINADCVATKTIKLDDHTALPTAMMSLELQALPERFKRLASV
jgi:hypothetical protein